MAYTSISHVAFGDNWSATSHNLLIDNAAAPFASAVQYSLLYWPTTTTISGLALSSGQIPLGSTTSPAAAYPQGIELPIASSIAPMSGVTAASLELIESSGAGTQKPVIYELLYATGADNGRMWLMKLRNAIGTPKLKVAYRMSTSSASKSLKWAVYVAKVSSGATSVSAVTFSTVNNQTDTPPSTSDVQAESSVSLANFASAVKDDWICIFLGRDTSVANNHGGVAKVSLVELQYG